jgi:hypothetical protein
LGCHHPLTLSDVEYSRTGHILKGQEKAKVQSKYEEDVYINNHTSVWGSWFDRDNGKWGFACCHSILSGSYCTGEAGKSATASSSAARLLESAPGPSGSPQRDALNKPEPDQSSSSDSRLVEIASSSKLKEKSRDPMNLAKRVDANEDVDIDRDRLRRAIAEEKKRKKMDDDDAWQATKKGKTDITQEELGAYIHLDQVCFTVKSVLADLAQRRTGCRNLRTRTQWRITKTKTIRVCNVRCGRVKYSTSMVSSFEGVVVPYPCLYPRCRARNMHYCATTFSFCVQL